MITLDHLSYSYFKGHDALSDITAEIKPGIHLLLGENGAGKTTLLRLLAGLLIPTSGTCKIDGQPSDCRLPSFLKKIFFIPDSMEIPAKTIRAFSQVHSRFYPRFNRELFEENLADFELNGDENFSNLSLGLRHKSLLAYFTALGTDVLLLDEPANGLDITSKKTLRRLLAKIADEERTIIVSTHTITDLRELYDGVMVLNHGQLLLSKLSAEISERISCIATTIPPIDPLFMEQGPGVFNSIVVNDTDESSELNYGLLYSSLLSPSREKILNAIHTKS